MSGELFPKLSHLTLSELGELFLQFFLGLHFLGFDHFIFL